MLGRRFLLALILTSAGIAVGVVRLVVDDDDVLVSRQLAQHARDEGLVALLALS